MSNDEAPRKKSKEPRFVAETFPARSVLKVDDDEVEFRKLHHISDLLFHPRGLKEEVVNARIVHALELYESLSPQEGAEGMLAAQMVGTHFAALDCLQRAI